VDRRAFVSTVALALLAAPLAAEAQQSKSTARLGFLGSSSAERDKGRVEAFHQGLQELGWVIGRNISIEQRFAAGQFDKLPALAADLVRLNPNVLVVSGAPAAHAAKNATRGIPIVMTNAADPVGTGLVASLARPGGNLTGLSDFNAGVVAKRLEILKEIVPSAARVAVLFNPGNPTNPLQLKLIREAAPALGVRLFSMEVRRADDIERAFAAMKMDSPDALMILGDPLLGSQARRILDLTMKNRLPSTYGTREWSEIGGLMSYGPSFEELYRRAATYVDKILKGRRPGDLPIEQPTKFELVINTKTAKALGLTIPQSLLLRADQVIE
jgi:putative tryptophan/tyrosine transport system substrate-binding protein